MVEFEKGILFSVLTGVITGITMAVLSKMHYKKIEQLSQIRNTLDRVKDNCIILINLLNSNHDINENLIFSLKIETSDLKSNKYFNKKVKDLIESYNMIIQQTFIEIKKSSLNSNIHNGNLMKFIINMIPEAKNSLKK